MQYLTSPSSPSGATIPVLVIRYEDLCLRLPPTLAAVLAFTDSVGDDGVIADVAAEACSPIAATFGRYLPYVSAKQLALVANLTAAAVQRHGYARLTQRYLDAVAGRVEPPLFWPDLMNATLPPSTSPSSRRGVNVTASRRAPVKRRLDGLRAQLRLVVQVGS